MHNINEIYLKSIHVLIITKKLLTLIFAVKQTNTISA